MYIYNPYNAACKPSNKVYRPHVNAEITYLNSVSAGHRKYAPRPVSFMTCLQAACLLAVLLHKIHRLLQHRVAGGEIHIEMEHMRQFFGMGFGVDLRLHGHAVGA